MRRILPVITMFLTLLSACAGGDHTPPTEIATQLATEPPIVETTEAPATATPTVEATKSPQDIADSLGLNDAEGYESRTYKQEDRDGVIYLVDTYNNAPKAVRAEDGSWRELDYTIPEDAEVMYGSITPDGEYVHEELHNLSGALSRNISFRNTGDWRVVEVTLPDGSTAHLYEVLGSLRDQGGALRLAWLALDAPDYGPEHIAEIVCSKDDILASNDGFMGADSWIDDLLTQLRVGEEIGMTIEETNTTVPTEKLSYFVGESFPEFNTAQAMLMTELYNKMADRFQLTTIEREALRQGQWPARVVELVHQRGFTIRRFSEADCPQYHAR